MKTGFELDYPTPGAGMRESEYRELVRRRSVGFDWTREDEQRLREKVKRTRARKP